jgi:hypothetical protein
MERVDSICCPTGSSVFNLEPDMDRMVVNYTDYPICLLDMDQSTGIQKATVNEKLSIQSSLRGTRLAQP